MRVTEAGRGEPVLMLHGFPQDSREWRDVVPEIAEHYRVICPDLRGAGETDAPADGYTSSQLQADLAALLDALELDQVHLVTHDWSSMLGFLFAVNHPDRVVDHLAMSVPPPGAKLDRGFPFRALRYGWFNLMLPWPGLGAWALRKTGLARHMLRAHSTSISADEAETFAAQFKDPARARAGSALYRTFIQPEGLRLMRAKDQSQVVTRVLVGTEDHMVKPNFEGAVAIDGAGHFLVDDRPTVVADQILQFLKR